MSNDMMQEEFVLRFNAVQGDFASFNENLVQDGREPMAQTTFYRRRRVWVMGQPPYTRSDRPRKPDVSMPVAGGTLTAPDRTRGDLRGKRFIFTAAQNNTYVHAAFLTNLEAFAAYRDAAIVVGKFRYNKSGFQNSTKDSDDDLWYDPKLAPYFVPESRAVVEALSGLVWCGELDILPTATNPLSGLDNYTHTASCIVPHAKVQLKSVPVLKGEPVKMMYTTGAVTQRNYIQRKAGQKADFHHVFGALYVEIDDDGDFFARQLIADSNGDFYDLQDYFCNGERTPGKIEAVNWGDIHAEMVDDKVAGASWRNADSILNVLQPYYQFVHDLTDFQARNHHNIKNPHFLARMHFAHTGNVEKGMKIAAETLAELERDFCTTVVVESNHDLAFTRWLSEADVRSDPLNAEYFHKANAEVYKNIRKGNFDFSPFEWAVRRKKHLARTLFLKEDDSFVICGANGIECGMHGHRGANGSRGNPNSLRLLGRKCNVGHSHSATILDGIYVAGASCKMDMGYNKGASSWSASHIVTYPNGKRQIITIKNGKWRA